MSFPTKDFYKPESLYYLRRRIAIVLETFYVKFEGRFCCQIQSLHLILNYDGHWGVHWGYDESCGFSICTHWTNQEWVW